MEELSLGTEAAAEQGSRPCYFIILRGTTKGRHAFRAPAPEFRDRTEAAQARLQARIGPEVVAPGPHSRVF